VLDALQYWSTLALTEGDAARAARLLAASEAGYDTFAIAQAPNHQAIHDKTMSAARSALGDEAFRTACDEGRAMTMDQAADYALEAV
jgi:hypothetical protein